VSHRSKRCEGLTLLYTFGKCWEIQHIFFDTNFRWQPMSLCFSEMGESSYTKFCDDVQPWSTVSKFVLLVRYVDSFRNWSAAKSKIRSNSIYLTPSL